MNRFEQAIAFLSPRMGFIRSQYRAGIDAAEKLRKYDAASHSARTKDWKATGTSANAELDFQLTTLRNRSRDLVRNNSYARRIKRVIPNNVVGSGIRPTPKKSDKKVSDKKLAELWEQWAESTQCDWNGRQTFYGIEKMVMAAVVESGAVLVLKRRHKTKSGIPLQLQVVEIDLLDRNRNTTLSTGGVIIQGIEFDESGKRVAYWLWDEHPGDPFRTMQNIQSRRVTADNVLHIFYEDRPGQLDGVPFMAAAMLSLRDGDNYEDTQLLRQTIAACYAVFYKDFNASVDNIDGLTKESDGTMSERVKPGSIVRVPSGKDVTFATPPPVEGFGEFMKTVHQKAAAGSGITYEAMTGDLSNVNFSSGRMGWLEMSREVEDWQEMMMIPSLCNPLWEWFMDSAIMAGKVSKFTPTTWTTPRREMIDPVKETKAIIDAMRAGLKPPPEALRELGYTMEEVLDEYQVWQKEIDARGLTFDSDARNDLKDPKTDGVTKPKAKKDEK